MAKPIKPIQALALLYILLMCTLLQSCNKQTEEQGVFYIDKVCPYTPVKDQGNSNSCWIYAMLATIESNRIAIGDSVNLSTALYERRLLEEEAEMIYRNKGKGTIHDRGMIPHLLTMVEKHGAISYSAYRRKKAVKSLTVLRREVEIIAKNAAKKKQSLKTMRKAVASHLDREIGYLPHTQYLYGVEYTYKQFARSVVQPDEYTVFGIDKKFPDWRPTDKITYCDQQKLFDITLESINKGFAVCWEGDMTPNNWTTTDDHCMEIIGLAHNKENEPFFVCKNSWGTNTPYKGLRFISFKNFQNRTICIAVKIKR